MLAIEIQNSDPIDIKDKYDMVYQLKNLKSFAKITPKVLIGHL